MVVAILRIRVFCERALGARLDGSSTGLGPNSYQTVAGTVDLTQRSSARRLRLVHCEVAPEHRASLLST